MDWLNEIGIVLKTGADAYAEYETGMIKKKAAEKFISLLPIIVIGIFLIILMKK